MCVQSYIRASSAALVELSSQSLSGLFSDAEGRGIFWAPHSFFWQERYVISQEPDGFGILCQCPQLSQQRCLSRPTQPFTLVSLSAWGRTEERRQLGILGSLLVWLKSGGGSLLGCFKENQLEEGDACRVFLFVELVRFWFLYQAGVDVLSCSCRFLLIVKVFFLPTNTVSWCLQMRK